MKRRTRFAAGHDVPVAFNAVQPSTAWSTVVNCPCCTNALPNRLPNDPEEGMNGATGRRVTRPRLLEYVVFEIHWKRPMDTGVIASSISVPCVEIWPPL